LRQINCNKVSLKVLITGSTGFVGKNLRDYFFNVGIEFLPLATIELAESNFYKVHTADIIVHLAGKAHDLKNISNSEEYYRINYDFTKHLYEAFILSKATKFIFVSSVKAAADHINYPLTEDYLPDPQSHYGKSKLLAEQYIQSAPLSFEKSWYILRPCMIHGPGNKGNLNLLYKFVEKGLPYPLAAFVNKRSFLSVENLCFVISELIKRKDIPSGVYNLADDEPLSTKDLVALISDGLKRPHQLLSIPEHLIRIMAKVGDFLRLPLNTERLNKLTENYIVCNKKIKQVLKKELPLSVREGILKTVQSFKDA
jgi:nucleoside-diphosphate-sugar epimerase